MNAPRKYSRFANLSNVSDRTAVREVSAVNNFAGKAVVRLVDGRPYGRLSFEWPFWQFPGFSLDLFSARVALRGEVRPVPKSELKRARNLDTRQRYICERSLLTFRSWSPATALFGVVSNPLMCTGAWFHSVWLSARLRTTVPLHLAARLAVKHYKISPTVMRTN